MYKIALFNRATGQVSCSNDASMTTNSLKVLLARMLENSNENIELHILEDKDAPSIDDEDINKLIDSLYEW